jgi:hypothetical protein
MQGLLLSASRLGQALVHQLLTCRA